jgi:hypothetical protein
MPVALPIIPGRATLWLLTGFALMMAMDVGLG